MEFLPDEILGEIILLLDIYDLSRLMNVSSSINRLITKYVQFIDSSEYLEIPLTWVSRFSRLRTTGNHIRILVHKDEIKLFSRLPLLVEMNLKLVGAASVTLPLMISKLLTILDKNINIRAIAGHNSFIIQGNRFATFGPQNGFGSFIKMCRPDILEIPFPIIDYGYMGESPIEIINKCFKTFLNTADFGLLNPRDPPSDENTSLTPLIRELGQSGAIDSPLMYRIYSLYGYYNRIREGIHCWPDNLLRNFFEKIVHQSHLNADPVEQNRWNYISKDGRWLDDETNAIMIEMTLPWDQTLHQFDLPELLSEERYNYILIRIRAAESKYSLQYRTGHALQDPFYREDGSISKWRNR